MRRWPWWALTLVFVAVGCGCDSPRAQKQPAGGSFTSRVFQLRIGDAVLSVHGATVTPEFFGSAETQPLVGRFFVGDDYVSATRRVVVLSHDLWAQRFSSSPGIIGREIEVDGHQATVVGVAPPGFRSPEGAELWTPREIKALKPSDK